jgi:hypothetical protein
MLCKDASAPLSVSPGLRKDRGLLVSRKNCSDPVALISFPPLPLSQIDKERSAYDLQRFAFPIALSRMTCRRYIVVYELNKYKGTRWSYALASSTGNLSLYYLLIHSGEIDSRGSARGFLQFPDMSNMVAWFGGEEEEFLDGVKFNWELIYLQRQQQTYTRHPRRFIAGSS